MGFSLFRRRKSGLLKRALVFLGVLLVMLVITMVVGYFSGISEANKAFESIHSDSVEDAVSEDCDIQEDI